MEEATDLFSTTTPVPDEDTATEGLHSAAPYFSARDTTERNQADDSLRENERRFREMIDALPTPIYTTDAQGRLTHFNPAAVKFAGYVPQLGSDEWCVSWKMYRPDGTLLPHDECPMAIALKEGRVIRDA
ncbi:MAG TPA: PAS domain S-box protein, partial [Nitrospira sp.]|nr:PAS domain S-box protein [Nitrospira sp.]